MKTTIIEDDIFEIGTFEEDGSVLLAGQVEAPRFNRLFRKKYEK